MNSYFKARVKHAIRFRHKRGFGVHSPFMFDFILNGIRDKKKKYKYPVEVEKSYSLNAKTKKLYRLVYRIAVHLNVKSVLCLSKNCKQLNNYLQELLKTGEYFTTDIDKLNNVDFIFIDDVSQDITKYIVESIKSREFKQAQCFFINHIHSKDINKELWKELRNKATVNMDMMWYGILLFNPKLQKGSYILKI